MLDVSKISKAFRGSGGEEITVLKDVNFTVDKGEFAILLGSNGSGKTTLLRIIAGDIEPDSGIILVDGMALSGVPAYLRAKHISFVRQSREENLVRCLSVLDVLMLVRSNRQSILTLLKRQSWEGAAKELLGTAKKGLENRSGEAVRSLSGGEHQVLTSLIAAELVRGNPRGNKVLLLDEHVAHLDPESARTVMRLTSELVSRYELTALMVTHNVQLPSEYGDRILVLKDHEIARDQRLEHGMPRDPKSLLELLF